jgi:hypothetical protein
MTRSIISGAALLCVVVPALSGQYLDARLYDSTPGPRHATTSFVQHGDAATWRRAAPHYGKWLTAAGTATFTVLGAEQHRLSRRIWDQLLDVCRSAQGACDVGADGRYLRADAESLYQSSRTYDRRANRWLLGAQASLIATAALFIIDLHPGEGPDNIPFAPVRVGLAALPGAALVEMRVRF